MVKATAEQLAWRKAKAVLRAGILKGTVPRAHLPFAVFTRELITNNPQMGVALIKKMWRALREDDHQVWRNKSDVEFAQQNLAAIAAGIHIQSSPIILNPATIIPPPPCLGVAGLPRTKATTWSTGDYVLMNSLASGSYGTVVDCVHSKTGRRLAMKIYKDSNADMLRELDIYDIINNMSLSKGASDGFFLKVLDFCSTAVLSWMVFPKAGLSLKKCIVTSGAMNQDDVSAVARQLVHALVFLEECRVAHLDLKPANILWNPCTKHLYVIDFGMSEVWPVPPARKLRYTEYVTVLYRPPELWTTIVAERWKVLGPKVDIWALGCVIYEAASAECLFAPTRTSSVQALQAELGKSVQDWCEVYQSLIAVELRIDSDCPFTERLAKLMAPWRSLILQCCHPTPATRCLAAVWESHMMSTHR